MRSGSDGTRALLAMHRSPDWTRALRILDAAYRPRVADESFVGALLQDDVTKGPCLAALQATQVGALVREWVGA